MLDMALEVETRAWCEDCGAAFPDPLDRLRGRLVPAATDEPDAASVRVTSPASCVECGGGRFALKTTFRVV